MPKLVDPTEQRRAIRSAARGVFAQRGVTGTGLAHVARAAGMGRSSLYHYYPDKQALLRDLVRDLLREEEAVFRRILRSDAPPLARIERLLRVLVQYFDEWAAAGRMLFDLRLRDVKRFGPFFRRIRAELARVVEEGRRAGEVADHLDPELAASILIGAVDGLLFQHFADARAFPEPEALVDATLDAARRVLAA